MEARGKLIVSASAPRSNYGEDLDAGWFKLGDEIKQGFSSAVFSLKANVESQGLVYTHTMDYTPTILHVFYVHAFVTQCSIDESSARKKNKT